MKWCFFLILGFPLCGHPARAASLLKEKPETLYISRAISGKGLFSKGIEGPAVDRQNNVYAVNFAKNGTIGILKEKQEPQLWLELPQGSIGNAIRFASESEMLVADRTKHRILQIDLVSKKIKTLVENPLMNQPNDFTVAANGDLFLSDPTWNSKKKGHIWGYVRGKPMALLADNLKAPNGIELSPDESHLYFTESIGGGLWVFDLKKGELKNKKLLYQFPKDTVDGLRVDTDGVLYVARIGRGQIDRISPEGKLLNSIPTLGKDPTNLAFGGPDGKTVYVTLRDGGYIESFRVPSPGREWRYAVTFQDAAR